MALTLGQFREVTKDGSEFVPLLVNGQPVASAALVRDGATGDLQCVIVTESAPTQPAVPQDVIQEEPQAPEVPQELEPPVIDETDKLDLQEQQVVDDADAQRAQAIDESPGQDDPADSL